MTRPDGVPGQDEAVSQGAGAAPLARPPALLWRVDRPIVLVGLMGAGKTTVGRRLAAALRLPFRDADHEIEAAAGAKVSEIFTRHGEAEFRRGERRVIARLLNEGPHVLATGGGAFMDAETRRLIRERSVSLWLRAELDVLMRRVERRDDRPLLKTADPRATMAKLMADRYPIYAEADFIVESGHGPHAVAVEAALRALAGVFVSGGAGAP